MKEIHFDVQDSKAKYRETRTDYALYFGMSKRLTDHLYAICYDDSADCTIPIELIVTFSSKIPPDLSAKFPQLTQLAKNEVLLRAELAEILLLLGTKGIFFLRFPDDLNFTEET